MNIFEHRDKLVSDYAAYTRSFIKIRDLRVRSFVETSLGGGVFWPEPLIQLNPTFLPAGTVEDLVDSGVLSSPCLKIFRIDKTDEDHTGKPLLLHTHQKEAILKAKEGKSYVLTSGTGSGKSLTYIVPIVDHVLRNGSGKGIQAIVVYPMNALANSQNEELGKFLEKGFPDGSPVRFARYTGQEKNEERENIRTNPPDILLTNYMMLELLLTRHEDAKVVEAAQNLSFLVFDELHTYRGRQGADVAMLIRRCRQAFGAKNLICVGTSATMASGGTSEDQKRQVAEVATTLFGEHFEKHQIIGETLERATSELNFNNQKVLERLKKAVSEEENPPNSYGDFSSHPLASWIESVFGVRAEAETGRLIRQTPRRLEGESIQGQASAAVELAKLTDCSTELCGRILRKFLLAGSDESMKRSASSRFPLFAFRLHQFFTRGDTVWSTLETPSNRYLDIAKKVSKPGEPGKPLFPMVFCRMCGCEYYRVKRSISGDRTKLEAREDRRDPDDDGSNDGYLYFSESQPWPREQGQALLDRLPDFMKEPHPRGGLRVKSQYLKDVPTPVCVAADGALVSDGDGLEATLIPRNFNFCLNPECGVIYTRNQRSERAKLATLGVDNRSTATTILAIRSLIELQSDRELERKARKLLSFTDNRQDASLQAGHFNDFAQVALLRSALHRATQSQKTGLGHGELSASVFREMNLNFEEYAADPYVRGPAKTATGDALRKVIEYYLYRDLQRGWRVTAPNLEDCGLLVFDYLGLDGADGLIQDSEIWEKGIFQGQNFIEIPKELKPCGREDLEQIFRTLLDVLRRGLAVKVDVLDREKQLDLVDTTKARLLEGTVWYLEDTRELTNSAVAYPRKRASDRESGLFISSYGGFGQYLKRTISPLLSKGSEFGRKQIDEIIAFLFLALKRYGIVEQVRGGDGGPGYQINSDALRWMPADGTIRPIDRTRLVSAGEIPPEVNEYFLTCYKTFVDLKCLLEAREHTAQVTSEDREERETRFRSGDLPLLFCSPTMELGVDIAQLNIVNLRNVPPTPANYSQRSGRAGRGGQPALVYTFCAGRSPHDQFYFREPGKMVAGSVTPPRIDICNRDLMRSHIHSIWMEVVKPDLGKTLTQVIELTQEGGKLPLRVKESYAKLLDNPAHRAKALAKCENLLKGIKKELEEAAWFHGNWAKEVLDQIHRSFDGACERWRSLYRAAMRQRHIHHQIVGDPSRSDAERNHSRRLRAQAESQIRILTEADGMFEGDFYSYRYFAAEGFLPGYNFPRLPLSAYVPGRRRRRGADEFISRPRFLAISEFGPRALVYHEGSRYRVYKVNLDFGSDDIESTHELSTVLMKRCTSCGYAHIESGGAIEVCARCGASLEKPSEIPNLVHLQNVSLKLAQRITCDEEERQRFGYKLISSYRFPEVGGKLDRKDAVVYSGDTPVLRLSYGDSTDLFRINLGWANQKPTEESGFKLDLERGYWARNQADSEDSDDATTEGRFQRVVPYVKDTKNALVMRFEPVREQDVMAALQAAFKESIQKLFQLEPRELSCEPMPSPKTRSEILFYEASEGGAGVLRQIVEDPDVIPRLARCALEICHYDPDTLADKGGGVCGMACYECLLDYGNQPDHKHLNRESIKLILQELSRSVCKPSGGVGSREERMVALRKACDSKLEKRWIDLIDKYMLRPPSDAQHLIESCSTRPDFFYREFNAAIYIDGPPHDEPDQIRKDEIISTRLMESGYIVVRFHHKADWEEILRSHPDIFGAISR
jgi:superfamily II DNA/RNA helicase